MGVEFIDTISTDRLSGVKNRNIIEQGRGEALTLLLAGDSLENVVKVMLERVEQADGAMRCAVLMVNPDNITLNPLVAPNLPTQFIQSLNNFPIAEDSGCCGAAVFNRSPVFVDNVYTHPNWENSRAVAKSAAVYACWSYPLISQEGEVYGSLAAFFSETRTPSDREVNALAYEAKILSTLIQGARKIDAIEKVNLELRGKVEERTRELNESNMILSKAIEQRNEVRLQLLEMENMAALGTMMSSLTHEINTPVGVAITASTYLKAMQQRSYNLFKNNSLKRSDLAAFYAECEEASNIIERNLNRTSQLIRTFKQLSIDQNSQEARPLNLCSYIDEVLLSLKSRLRQSGHVFCIDIDADLEIRSNPGALSQILINLITNSMQHAFSIREHGQITITARLDKNIESKQHLVLTYSDNGKGMTEHMVSNIYKPFFNSARPSGGNGLGMHVCYNLAVEALNGSIDCESAVGKGTKITLRFPVET